MRVFHAETIAKVIEEVETLSGRRIFVDPETSLLELNHNLFISIVISRCFVTYSNTRRWKIRLDSGLHPDITIAVRMDSSNENIHDYYILPSIEFSNNKMMLFEDNSGLMDSFRTDTLDYLLNISINISIDKAVQNETRNNHAYLY